MIAPSETTERAPWTEPIGAAIATTALVTVLSYFCPPDYAASAVGLAFLGATYFLALRSDDPDAARRYGLSLGGLLDPEPLDGFRLLREAAREAAFVAFVAAIVLPPFWFGYLAWWSPAHGFHPAPLRTVAEEALGQILVIALPEEAFYRGYLQTRLDEAWPARVRILGVPLGPAVVVTSLLFALGHVATEVHPNRLAVFFPSLLFGYLRTRRGGIGASLLFHAVCNLFASYLGRSYGLFG